MGLPVVTVASGGLPVVESTIGGTPVTEAANGYGVPVTKVVGKPGLPVVFETIGLFPGGAAAQAFLARTSGLNATHINAYAALIDGLVADGLWSKFDVLHVYATQNAATANLNLIGNIYNAIPISSPVFTVDRGYTGSEAGNYYLDTGFNPSTAPSPKLVQNSAHISVWPLNEFNTTRGFVIGANEPTQLLGLHVRFSNNSHYYVNTSGSPVSVASASSIGHFLGNRTTNVAVQGYKNGVSVITNGANTSSAPVPRTILVPGQNQVGTIFGSDYQVAMASLGSSLSAGEVTSFYNRLRTYMTAVGVP